MIGLLLGTGQCSVADVKLSDKNEHLPSSHHHLLTAGAITTRPDTVTDTGDESALTYAFGSVSLSHQHQSRVTTFSV